jgi:hypothetical protein
VLWEKPPKPEVPNLRTDEVTKLRRETVREFTSSTFGCFKVCWCEILRSSESQSPAVSGGDVDPLCVCHVSSRFIFFRDLLYQLELDMCHPSIGPHVISIFLKHSTLGAKFLRRLHKFENLAGKLEYVVARTPEVQSSRALKQ